MPDISSFVDRAMKGLTGCPFPLVKETFIDVLAEFAEKTWIFTYDFTATVDVSEAVDADLNNAIDVDVSSATESDALEAVSLLLLKIDGHELPTKFLQLVNAADTANFVGETKYFYFSSEQTVRIFPINETEDFELYLSLVFKPLKTITTIPQFVWELWERYLTAGVRAELQGMDKKPWTSPAKAAANLRLFNDGIVLAKTKRLKGYSSNDTAVEFRPWV